MQLAEAIVAPGLVAHLLVVLQPAVVTEPPAPVEDAGVVAAYGASLAGHHHFVRIEAEHPCVAEGPAGRPAQPAADGFAGVLDDMQPVFPRDIHHRRHVRRTAEDVDGEDRAGAPRDGRRYPGRVDVPAFAIDVYEYRHGSDVVDRTDRGDERERRRDDLVTGSDAAGPEREDQAGGPGTHRDGARRAAHPGQPILEQ
jgi:hypothetical protein